MDNISLFHLIFNLKGQNPLLDQLMIFGAEYVIYLTFFLIFILGVRGNINDKKSLIVILIAFPIMVIIIKTIHLFLNTSRPFVAFDLISLISEEADASFPSRHTSTMAIIAWGYLFYKSKWAPLLLVLMLWVGISRVYVGVHYPIDIIGGIAVGLISILIALRIKNLLRIRFLGKPLKS